MTAPDSSPWYRWPENRMKGVVPWFVVLRRVIFWPLLLVGMCLIFVAVMGGYGVSDAKRTWRSIA